MSSYINKPIDSSYYFLFFSAQNPPIIRSIFTIKLGLGPYRHQLNAERGDVEAVGIDSPLDKPLPNGMARNMVYDRNALAGNVPPAIPEQPWFRLRFFLDEIIPNHALQMRCAAPWHAGMAYVLGYLKTGLKMVKAESPA